MENKIGKRMIVGFAAAVAICADAKAGPSVVQSCPGYNAWPMIQAVGDKLVCAYSRGSAHAVGEGLRGVFARTSKDGVNPARLRFAREYLRLKPCEAELRSREEETFGCLSLRNGES